MAKKEPHREAFLVYLGSIYLIVFSPAFYIGYCAWFLVFFRGFRSIRAGPPTISAPNRSKPNGGNSTLPLIIIIAAMIIHNRIAKKSNFVLVSIKGLSF